MRAALISQGKRERLFLLIFFLFHYATLSLYETFFHPARDLVGRERKVGIVADPCTSTRAGGTSRTDDLIRFLGSSFSWLGSSFLLTFLSLSDPVSTYLLSSID